MGDSLYEWLQFPFLYGCSWNVELLISWGNIEDIEEKNILKEMSGCIRVFGKKWSFCFWNRDFFDMDVLVFQVSWGGKKNF